MDGDRLEMIDQPERPLYLNTVKDWVIRSAGTPLRISCAN